jgi:hypothetical protein
MPIKIGLLKRKVLPRFQFELTTTKTTKKYQSLRGLSANCYPQVPKRPFFILFPALVLALVRYLVMVLANLSKKNLISQETYHEK